MTPAITCTWLGRIDYAQGLAIQEETVAGVRDGRLGPTLLLLEHHPVFTIGRTRDQSSLMNRDLLPYPVHETNRGGQATYHGPGQLVGYPILDLHHHGKDLHKYLRFLEQVLIDSLDDLGIQSHRSDGLTGVWVGDGKIASIGVGVRHWIAMHGFALNVCGALDGFDHIIPCGISKVKISSIERELASSAPTVEAVAKLVGDRFGRSLAAL